MPCTQVHDAALRLCGDRPLLLLLTEQIVIRATYRSAGTPANEHLCPMPTSLRSKTEPRELSRRTGADTASFPRNASLTAWKAASFARRVTRSGRHERCCRSDGTCLRGAQQLSYRLSGNRIFLRQADGDADPVVQRGLAAADFDALFGELGRNQVLRPACVKKDEVTLRL